jgi:hypothetical protein
MFDEHPRYMDALIDEGFIVLGGPLDERDVLLAVRADTAISIRERLAADPWIANGMLSITGNRPWSILLEREPRQPSPG